MEDTNAAAASAVQSTALIKELQDQLKQQKVAVLRRSEELRKAKEVIKKKDLTIQKLEMKLGDSKKEQQRLSNLIIEV